MRNFKQCSKFILVTAAMLTLGACGGSSSDDAAADEADGPADVIDSSAPLVRSLISKQNLVVGDRIEIEISAENLPRSEGGGISLRFDPDVLRVDSIELDAGWEFARNPGSVDNRAGEVNNILFASYQGYSGTVPIATVSASVIGSGDSAIRIVESAINPFGSNGQTFAVQFVANGIVVR